MSFIYLFNNVLKALYILPTAKTTWKQGNRAATLAARKSWWQAICKAYMSTYREEIARSIPVAEKEKRWRIE